MHRVTGSRGRPNAGRLLPPRLGGSRRAASARRAGVLLVIATASLLLASPALARVRSGGLPLNYLSLPRSADLARAAAFRDSVLQPRVVRLVNLANTWGGSYTTQTGEVVRILASDSYPREESRTQSWANFLASLVHGRELSGVTLLIAPEAEVAAICGAEALACYSPRDSLIVAPGDDPDAELTSEAVITHEYGHHVANNRDNSPWNALDWGTKRWATYERVCPRAEAGQLFPGNEGAQYQLNPGEGFAETYRWLNQLRLGQTPAPWTIVTGALFPDQQALAVASQDVTSPWAGPTRTTAARTLRARGRWNQSVATPLDGTLNVAVRGTSGSRLRIQLLSAGAAVAQGTSIGTRTASLRTTVCGQRSYSLRIQVVRGSARPARVTVTRP